MTVDFTTVFFVVVGDVIQAFKEVSVMFSDVVDFNYICSQVTPMQIVSLLNAYFTKLDLLSEKHQVHKVTNHLQIFESDLTKHS